MVAVYEPDVVLVSVSVKVARTTEVNDLPSVASMVVPVRVMPPVAEGVNRNTSRLLLRPPEPTPAARPSQATVLPSALRTVGARVAPTRISGVGSKASPTAVGWVVADACASYRRTVPVP